ncbi:MAG: DUF2147 domain-containing protein [Pseudomonadota bacterium]
MRTAPLLLALGLAVGLAGTAFADPSGLWKSEPNDKGRFIQVSIEPCGPNFCGTIVESNSPKREELVGRAIIMDMAPAGENRWEDGSIWAPDDDETYDAKMELLDANRLEVSGCALLGLVCRGQIWTRVDG